MEPAPEALEALVQRAGQGDRAALEAVVRRVQDPLYALALRILWHPDDAREATQEILIKLLTRLSSFEGRSQFMTWAYRVAANHLLDFRKARAEQQELSFHQAGIANEDGLRDPPLADGPDSRLLAEDVKVGCAHGVLLCLSRDLRLAYVLGEIFDLGAEEGAEVLSLSAAAYRQRLSRARALVRGFMGRHCGIVDESRACRCEMQVRRSVRKGLTAPGKPLFAGTPSATVPRVELLDTMRALDRTAALYRSLPCNVPRSTLLDSIRTLLDSGALQLLDDHDGSHE